MALAQRREGARQLAGWAQRREWVGSQGRGSRNALGARGAARPEASALGGQGRDAKHFATAKTTWMRIQPTGATGSALSGRLLRRRLSRHLWWAVEHRPRQVTARPATARRAEPKDRNF